MCRVLLITVLSIPFVNSLYCFISDFENIYSQDLSQLKHTLGSCHDYNNITKNLKLQIPAESVINCYTVEITRDVVIKGCVQSGGCTFLVDFLKKLVHQNANFDSLPPSGKVECVECGTSGCNNVNKNTIPSTTPAALTLRSETSLKCHHCLEPCELTKAREKICGGNIGPSYEAVCTTEVAKNSDNPDLAVRKCQIIRKNAEPPCPESSVCSFCKSDMCTSSGGNVARTALLALALVYLGTSEFF
ncbi:uncharacterized protein LOC103314041 isoform X2 [Tribolium castaneum]|uniref:uncharacterized protein LOC103314041 isoform X2 n=1 Tax=Tribolium castaneum TaxID=7070 RepID=UPI00046C0241|nr:PREDICTED: uncharacterized protein LOC103314041 isoform X2 [Tribolium castaneum]|eukprot:XP_008197024.1 PREDICTED: uncharacterized protein LOC103314041 isoform X2 [Tribolium castaneum]